MVQNTARSLSRVLLAPGASGLGGLQPSDGAPAAAPVTGGQAQPQPGADALTAAPSSAASSATGMLTPRGLAGQSGKSSSPGAATLNTAGSPSNAGSATGAAPSTPRGAAAAAAAAGAGGGGAVGGAASTVMSAAATKAAKKETKRLETIRKAMPHRVSLYEEPTQADFDHTLTLDFPTGK